MTAFTGAALAAKPSRSARFVLVFIVMLLANSVQSFVFSVPPPVLPALSQAFNLHHHGVLIAEFVTPIAALGMMVGALFSGGLIARTGLRRMLLATAFLIALTGSAPLWASTAAILLGGRLVLGFAAALMLTCSTLLVVQNFTDQDRPRIIGYQTAFASVIFVVAVMSSGLILRNAGWRAPFAIYAVFGILLFILSFISTPKDAGIVAPEEIEDSAGVLQLLWPIYITVLLFGVLVTIAGVQFPFLMTSRGIVSPIVQSFVIGNSTIFSAISGFSYGHIQAKIGRRRTLALSLLGDGLGFIVLGFATNAVTACIGTALIGLGQGFFVAYLISLTVQHAPPAVVGRAIGYAVAGLFLGSFMDPFFMNGLNVFFGPAGAFFAVGALTLAGALACFVARRGILIGVPRLV